MSGIDWPSGWLCVSLCVRGLFLFQGIKGWLKLMMQGHCSLQLLLQLRIIRTERRVVSLHNHSFTLQFVNAIRWSLHLQWPASLNSSYLWRTTGKTTNSLKDNFITRFATVEKQVWLVVPWLVEQGSGRRIKALNQTFIPGKYSLFLQFCHEDC